ncbi:hypothetical protein KP509_01G047900 [Ceratopteris richardii]|uniref:Cytochrome P450 n=1 Tax=Ceratopteris richardii TaxID=49495 RepID=A0A8T2VCP2_CERRI|nr:hypothetical protein KP509_01G047900 [Ceratopteris richardii]
MKRGRENGLLDHNLTWQWALCVSPAYMRRQRGSKDPRTSPLFGAQWEAMANMHQMHCWFQSFFTSSHRTVTLRTFAGRIMYHTVDPVNVHYILKDNFQNYPKGERVHSVLHDFMGDGIFNSDGKIWRKHRKIASFEFSNRKLKQMSLTTFRRDALRLLHLLHTFATSRHSDLFMRMTMDSLCKLLFGMDGQNLESRLPEDPFGKAFDNFNDIIITRRVNPFWKIQRALNMGKEKIVNENLEVLNSLISNIIEKRKENMSVQVRSNAQKADELLSRFMQYNEADYQKTYHERELRDFIVNFKVAGRDTTAIALSWFIYCICKHPHVAEKIRRETAEFLSLENDHNMEVEETANKLDYECLARMNYLHASIRNPSTLPTSSQVIFYFNINLCVGDGKTVLKDDVLPDGTYVKRGAQISYVPYSMGRMEFLWSPDALEYKPERWLKDGAFQPESPFKFTAFQAGPRMCLGKDYAYVQMTMTASLLLHFFRFDLVDNGDVKYRVMMIMPIAGGLNECLPNSFYIRWKTCDT